MLCHRRYRHDRPAFTEFRSALKFGCEEVVITFTAKSWKTTLLVIVLMLVLCPGAWPQVMEEARDEPIRPSPNPMNVTTDALLLRPIGLVMIPVTAIIYVISYPFAKASGSEEETYQSLVGDTIEYTFKRPLGEGAPFE